MKITIYFNPDTLKVLDEEHFQQIVTNHTEKACDDPKTFRGWLTQNFNVEKLFYMDESDKRQARSEYNSYCYKSAKKTLLQRYEKRGRDLISTFFIQSYYLYYSIIWRLACEPNYHYNIPTQFCQ